MYGGTAYDSTSSPYINGGLEVDISKKKRNYQLFKSWTSLQSLQLSIATVFAAVIVIVVTGDDAGVISFAFIEDDDDRVVVISCPSCFQVFIPLLFSSFW